MGVAEWGKRTLQLAVEVPFPSRVSGTGFGHCAATSPFGSLDPNITFPVGTCRLEAELGVGVTTATNVTFSAAKLAGSPEVSVTEVVDGVTVRGAALPAPFVKLLSPA